MAIQCINDDECLKVMLKVKMSSSLMIMSLQVIINNAFHILKKLIKQRNQRLIMTEKLSMMLQCFKLIKINVKTF